MKTIKHLICSALLFAGLFTVLSCNNLLEQSDENSKTYISVSYKTSNQGRTIFPNIDTNNFDTPELKGVREGSGEEQVFDLTASSTVEVLPGRWTFSIKVNYVYTPDPEDPATTVNVIFTDTVTINIIQGTENSILFNLKPQGDEGSFKLTLNLISNSGISKVKATLKNRSGEVIDNQTFDFSELTGDARIASYGKNNLPADTYYVLFDYYADNDPTPVNQWESYINIMPFLVSEATVNINFNEIYSIEYKTTNEENEIIDIDFTRGEYSGTAIKKYSKRSSFELPVCTNPPEGKIFLGWKTDPSSTDPVTEITRGTSGDISLTPYFVDPELYVSDWYAYRDFTAQVEEQTAFTNSGGILGDNTNLGFVSTAPLKTVDAACEKIIEYGRSDLDWKIYVTGKITGTPTHYNVGRTEIPESLTTDYAKTITIEGTRGLNDGIPQDIMDRGALTNSSDFQAKGNVLVVESTVPVTIKNLKMTGGNTYSSSTVSTDPLYSTRGGGIHIAEGATVSLADGVMIYKNKSTYGGGIYNAGTLYVYGTAVIGITSQETEAHENNANYGDDGGGGIYNVGNVYLGYSDYVDENTNTEASWTGCIGYNYSWRGGAINNRPTGKIVMHDGHISNNECVSGGNDGGGGGIYNFGSFIMSGGTIEGNKSLNEPGGGIYNNSSSYYGTGTFIFSGGVIKSNKATSSGKGGGVYNSGIMYMYGDAVIGDPEASSSATEEDCSNSAGGIGGGICIGSSGKFYMGYKSFQSPIEYETAPFNTNKGIFHNYSANGGGGIAVATNNNNKSSNVYINDGVIANNGVLSTKSGGAIYVDDNFTLSGSPSIPAGVDNKNDVYMFDTWAAIELNAPLDPSFEVYLTCREYSRDSRQPILIRSSGVDTNDVSITTEASKFTIAPQPNANLEAPIEWEIREEDGKGYMKTVLPQASTSNCITIDLRVSTNDLDIRTEGSSGAYSKTGTTYTLLDPSKTFKIYLYNAGNYQDWTWILDDEEISTKGTIIFGNSSSGTNTEATYIDITSWTTGVYDLCLECIRKDDGLKYSHTIQIKIE